MTTAKFKDKNLIVFDLDGTLTPSKSNMEPDMASALATLLSRKKVAVIGGGSWSQFKRQFLNELACPRELLQNLFLFPTTAMTFYRYQNGWKKVYSHKFSKQDAERIRKAFRETFIEVGYRPPQKTYGKVIENRGSQITFSVFGQDVVVRLGKKGLMLKETWRNENTPLKLKMAKLLAKKLPQFEVRAAGFTSIDITKKGVDKAYGVRQIEKYVHMPVRKMLFVGDALFPGGNDAAAKKTGIQCVSVRGPKDTEQIIKYLISNT